MTLRAFEAQASWLALVVGMTCSAVQTDGEQILSLHFGELREQPGGELESERTISFEGAWRIERGDEIIAGAADPDDERMPFLQELTGKLLERVEVTRPGYDLTLHLAGEYRARCFPIDSLEYADDVEDAEDVEVSWWVTGAGIADDWETARAE